MTLPNDRALLEQLFDLSDELRRAGTTHSCAPETVTATEQIKRANRFLSELDPKGEFARFLSRYRFKALHTLVLIQLLRQRMESRNAFVAGREILARLFDSTFECVSGMKLLSPGSRLMSSGFLIPDLAGSGSDAEILDLRYRLSDQAMQFFLRILRQGPSPLERRLDREPHPYRNNLSYLMDVRRLARLYQRRATQVFHHETWTDEAVASEPVVFLNQQIRDDAGFVERCLEMTPNATQFPAVKLGRRFKLEPDHVLILVTLAFQELLHGNPYVDAADLLKLVSKSEEDLIRKRKIFGKHSPLLRHRLIALEEIIHDKPLSAEVYLPNAVLDEFLGTPGLTTGTIDPDSKIEFHEFLKELESSDDFFEQL